MPSSTIQVIAELVAPLWLAARTVLLAMLVAGGLVLVGLATAALLRLRGHRTEPTPTGRRVRLVGSIAIAAAALLTIAAETIGFAPIVRWAIARHPDITIGFESAHGSFLFGRIELAQVALRRDDPVRGSFDLRVAQIALDFDALGTLLGRRDDAQLDAQSIRGSCSRDLDRFAPRREHALARLRIADAAVDVQVELRDRTQTFVLVVDNVTVAPYRATHSWVDVVQRANGRGTIEGRPFTAAAGTWHIDGLPVRSLTEWIGGPLTLLDDGALDATVCFGPSDVASGRFDSRWQLEFRRLRLGVPDSAGKAAGLALSPLIRWANSESRSFAIELSLPIDGSVASDPSAHRTRQRALRRELGFAIVDALAHKAGIDGATWRRVSALGRSWFAEDDAAAPVERAR